MTNEDELLTINEVAGILKVDRRTVYTYMDRDRLKFTYLGRRRRIRRRWLDEFIEKGVPAPEAERDTEQKKLTPDLQAQPT